jgi:hypothetical protein
MPVLALLSMAALVLSCGSTGGDGAASSLRSVLSSVEDGFVLAADPDEARIDTTDPNAPVDPGTGLYFTEVELTAVASDPEGNPQPDLEVVFSTSDGDLESGGDPVVTDENGMAIDRLRVFEDDDDEITVTATDGDRTDTLTLVKTVIYPNRPPVADAGEDQTVACVSDGGTIVQLDGTGSSDPDSTPGTNDDIVSFEWFTEFGEAGETPLGEGAVIETSFDLGVHVVTLRVTDSEGETDMDETSVEVIDDAPPSVTAYADPAELWPPNHRMVPVHVSLHVEDCSPFVVTLESVTSNEPANSTGDGNTEPDIEGAEIGSEDYDFLLRAERSGGGSGRVYTATYLVVDDEGFETWVSVEILVPHDQGS